MANEYIYINHKFKVDNSDFFLYIFILFSLFFFKIKLHPAHYTKKTPKNLRICKICCNFGTPLPLFFIAPFRLCFPR